MKLLLVPALLLALSAIAGDFRPEPASDRDRIARRFDLSAAEQRRAAAIAAARIARDTKADVVLGSEDPELLLPWELVDRLANVLGDDVVLETYRERWTSRGSERYLGDDFVNRLRAALGPLLNAEAKRRALQAELSRDAGNREAIQAEWSRVNSSICRLRADVLAESHKTFGHKNFQRFLYEVVAPEAVVLTSPSSSPEATIEMWLWIEGNCQ